MSSFKIVRSRSNEEHPARFATLEEAKDAAAESNKREEYGISYGGNSRVSAWLAVNAEAEYSDLAAAYGQTVHWTLPAPAWKPVSER